jgi:uncharacterized protein (DUF433 family)
MLEWNECDEVERKPGRVSGAWLFKGTRIPVKALFENLEERRNSRRLSELVPRGHA